MHFLSSGVCDGFVFGQNGPTTLGNLKKNYFSMVLCRSTIIFDATVCDFTSNHGVRLKTLYCCV